MSKLTKAENIIYQLETLSSYEPSDLDNPEFEVAYEMPTGEESFATVCCIDNTKQSLELIGELSEYIESILSIEEEGHRFSSDDALAEIFNKCREALSK